ncbi:AAA family ATPase [Oceaniglobus ichthyenteri]|uniref:AAA family ATPase n=1 Tax=Oceaniglobus ichthyenteri TaxID=2136177 RepID=UPI001F0CA56A|nr:AAA family ATPase [Oceaniglobus ichthyenteri]
MSAMIRFIPVAELNDPLTLAIGLSGGSGTGKTYSALLMARGIAEVTTGKTGAPIGYVDTENRRALHYKQAFPEMCHFDMKAVDDAGKMIGFGPERWIEVIDAAEAANLPVVILDSFSHAWEGVGGVLDLQAQVLDRLTGGDDSKKNQRSQLAWAEVKPRYRRLIDRIVRAKCSMIICTRAKPVMQEKSAKTGWKEVNARATKTRRQDVPWDPASDGDLMFEMTAMVILDPSAPGCPVHQIKVADQFKGLLDARRPMGVETGRAMAEWAKSQGSGQQDKAVLDSAREAARGGKEAFTTWWNEHKEDRALVKTILAECQDLAANADAAKDESESDDPFANTDDAPRLTPEQEAEIQREIDERNARESA